MSLRNRFVKATDGKEVAKTIQAVITLNIVQDIDDLWTWIYWSLIVFEYHNVDSCKQIRLMIITLSWKFENVFENTYPKGKFKLSPQEQRQGNSVKSFIWRTINRNQHTNMVTHPSTNRGRCCLTPLYQLTVAVMPITTERYIVFRLGLHIP